MSEVTRFEFYAGLAMAATILRMADMPSSSSTARDYVTSQAFDMADCMMRQQQLREDVPEFGPIPDLKFNACVESLRKFYGIDPYDVLSNPCRSDARYYQSIRQAFDDSLIRRAAAHLGRELEP